jgi:hypothetical protein
LVLSAFPDGLPKVVDLLACSAGSSPEKRAVPSPVRLPSPALFIVFVLPGYNDLVTSLIPVLKPEEGEVDFGDFTTGVLVSRGEVGLALVCFIFSDTGVGAFDGRGGNVDPSEDLVELFVFDICCPEPTGRFRADEADLDVKTSRSRINSASFTFSGVVPKVPRASRDAIFNVVSLSSVGVEKDSFIIFV